MLFSNLEREGLDLSIQGNLIYFDVNRLRVGINNSSPQVELDVVGNTNISGNTTIGGTMAISGNTTIGGNTAIIGNAAITGTVSITSEFTGNSYSLPVEPGEQGYTIISDGAGSANWAPNTVTINRRQFHHFIENLPSGANELFVMDIGLANIVYGLTVNRPVLVEVFSNQYINEPNPYTFLATADHLTDDGSVLLDDGSIIQQRQYSIFANQDVPPKPQVYARVTNIDGVSGNVSLSLTYFAAVTDNSAKIYDANVVDVLPISGYTGQTVVLTTDHKMYVWYNAVWNPTS